MFLRKSTSDDLSREIQQLTQDYEKLAKEQKERILALREQNRTLNAQLEACLQEKTAVANTLIHAEHAGRQLIEDAKQRSDQLLSEAYRKEAASRKRIQTHRSMLEELAHSCEQILTNIEAELKQSSSVFTLDLSENKQA